MCLSRFLVLVEPCWDEETVRRGGGERRGVRIARRGGGRQWKNRRVIGCTVLHPTAEKSSILAFNFRSILELVSTLRFVYLLARFSRTINGFRAHVNHAF